MEHRRKLQLKKMSLLFLLTGIVVLAACTSENKDSVAGIEWSDSESQRVEAAKKDVSQKEFNDAIEETNEEIAKENDSEIVNLFEGATYEAYLLARAKLSQESFEIAKKENVFAAEVRYDDYQSVANALVTQAEYQEQMVADDEKGNYGAYIAKSIQYLTPEGIPN